MVINNNSCIVQPDLWFYLERWSQTKVAWLSMRHFSAEIQRVKHWKQPEVWHQWISHIGCHGARPQIWYSWFCIFLSWVVSVVGRRVLCQ